MGVARVVIIRTSTGCRARLRLSIIFSMKMGRRPRERVIIMSVVGMWGEVAWPLSAIKKIRTRLKYAPSNPSALPRAHLESIIIMTVVIPVEYHNISLMVVLNAMLALPVRMLSASGNNPPD